MMTAISFFVHSRSIRCVREITTSNCFIFTVIAAALFCWVTRRSRIRKGETLIDPYDDIRETIYNYDEEGMPEEDQDGYDISRLSKPVYPHIQPVQDKPVMGAPPRKILYYVII